MPRRSAVCERLALVFGMTISLGACNPPPEDDDAGVGSVRRDAGPRPGNDAGASPDIDAGDAPDAGEATDAGAAGTDAGGAPVDAGPALRPVFVAVGYAGLRVRSQDRGLTWTDEQTAGPSGDNEYLIRGVAFGEGLFVAAAGYPNGVVRTSPDGAVWTDRTIPTNQWIGGVVYFRDHFVAVGGSGVRWVSDDGISWSEDWTFGGLGMRTVVVGGDTLMAAGNGAWWRSDDAGESWERDSSRTTSNEIKIAYCDGDFREIGDGDYSGMAGCDGFTRCRGAVHADGVYLRVSGRRIERSLDGSSWDDVYTAGASLEDVTVGYLP